MASQDYYNRAYPPSYRTDPSYYTEPAHPDHSEVDLSPLPSTSPFDDQNYPYSHSQPSHSYGGSDARLRDESDPDPFNDDNAVPLRAQARKHDSQSSVAPIVPPETEIGDDFIRDAKPRRAKRRRSKDGWFTGKITWVCYLLTVVQLIVFVVEIIKNGIVYDKMAHLTLLIVSAILTKSPIEIHPQFNPMIGPSPYLLINMGARYQPCMHNMPGVQNSSVNIMWPCPNATSTDGSSVSCSLSELCGFSGVPNPHIDGSINDKPAPNQWFRFIVPIFLHAGIIHIGFNLLLQMTLGRDVEKMIGSIRFTLVYFAAGIFGFVLGGNFAATGIASTGCSGSLFGILALTLLDLLYTWKQRKSPLVDLLFIVIDVIIAFVLGLLPGLDNFSHIGGFLMGLVLGVCILRSPSALSRRIGQDPPYADFRDTDRNADVFHPVPPLSHANNEDEGLRGFVKRPLGFFQGRRGVWWVWWLVRVGALLGALIGFILLLKNFYQWRTTCSWCKYLSCLPVNNWCTVGNLDFTPQSTKRDLLDLTREVFEGVKLEYN